MKKLFKLIVPSTCILALLTLAIGGIFAVLQTQTNSVENSFELVYMDIITMEPSWPADSETIMTTCSGQTISKDPLVSNTGSRDVYVYISVFVPDNPNTADEDVAFTYNYNDTYWDLIQEQPQFDENNLYIGTTFYYGYKNVVKPGENTEPVFNKVTFMTYNIDDENALEDSGEGSKVLGNAFNIIVNGYALTTDVNDVMHENMYYNLMGNNAFYNGGIGTAWNYLTKEILDNLEEGESAPSYTSVVAEKNSFTVDFCDEEGHVLHTATIYACNGDILNVNFVNDYMKNRIECASFQNTEDLYSHISDENGDILFFEPTVLNSIVDENNTGSFRITVNTKYAYVYVSLVAEGQTQQVIALQFESGETISNETISTKLSELIGQTINIPSPEINEIAAVGDTYNLSIDISAIMNQ